MIPFSTGGGQFSHVAAAGHRLEGRSDVSADEGQDQRDDLEAQQGRLEEEDG